MNADDVIRVLRPISDLAVVDRLDGPSLRALAGLISPRNAADLTVRELLDLVNEVAAKPLAARKG